MQASNYGTSLTEGGKTCLPMMTTRMWKVTQTWKKQRLAESPCCLFIEQAYKGLLKEEDKGNSPEEVAKKSSVTLHQNALFYGAAYMRWLQQQPWKTHGSNVSMQLLQEGMAYLYVRAADNFLNTSMNDFD